MIYHTTQPTGKHVWKPSQEYWVECDEKAQIVDSHLIQVALIYHTDTS
jgi:hypothetical protein